MARARNIKPAFFKNEALGDLPYECRLLFIGLWTLADREGRLEDRPRRIRAEIFPFDSIDVDPMLDQLQEEEFLLRYEVDGERFIEVLNFVKHQDPHYKEKASEIPPPHGRENIIKATAITKAQRARIFSRDDHCCQQCGAEENLCIDHIIPTSRGGDSSDENLQVLCMKCNTKKGNKLDGESKGKKKSKHMDTAVIVRHNVNLSIGQVRVEDGPNSNERNDASPSDSLIPDSLSLIPDPPNLIPESATSPEAPSAARGSRLPKSWEASPEQIAFCEKERPDLTPSLVASRFRDYWVAIAGAKGRKLDWDATWRNWVRSEKGMQARASPQAKFDPVAYVNRNRPNQSHDNPDDIIEVEAKPLA